MRGRGLRAGHEETLIELLLLIMLVIPLKKTITTAKDLRPSYLPQVTW